MKYRSVVFTLVMVSGAATAGFEGMMNPMAMMPPMSLMAAPMGMGMMSPLGMAAPMLGMGAMYPAMQMAPNLLSFGHINQMRNPYLGGPVGGNPYLGGSAPGMAPSYGYPTALFAPAPAMPTNPYLWPTNPPRPAAAPVAPAMVPFAPAWLGGLNPPPATGAAPQ